MRTDIEDRIREAKLGAGLIHLPSVSTATITAQSRGTAIWPTR